MKTRLALLVPAAILTAGLLSGQQIKKVPPASTRGGDGKEMFATYCAACHGKDAKGDGPAATALKKKPADLTVLAAHNKGVFPAQEVFRYSKGVDQISAHGSRDMPVWGDMFRGMQSPDDTAMVDIRVNVLSEYLKSLQSK
jgi:mono/diheme cytochrome c family protein